MEKLPGDLFMVTVMSKRSLPHNRLYFSAIGSMVKAGAPGDRVSIHSATKIKTGLVTMCQLPNGEFMAFPDSTAFNRMDQSAFNAWFVKAVEFWKVCGLWQWVSPDIRAKIDTGESQGRAA